MLILFDDDQRVSPNLQRVFTKAPKQKISQPIQRAIGAKVDVRIGLLQRVKMIHHNSINMESQTAQRQAEKKKGSLGGNSIKKPS